MDAMSSVSLTCLMTNTAALTARIVAVYPDRLPLRVGNKRRTLRVRWELTRQALALFYARAEVRVAVEDGRMTRIERGESK